MCAYKLCAQRAQMQCHIVRSNGTKVRSLLWSFPCRCHAVRVESIADQLAFGTLRTCANSTNTFTAFGRVSHFIPLSS
ncbi:hypothetical protein T4C_7484 [Trichinella pseudospiralis]|uniref:Uncharacterized protein n=2 Tax=Trichinella pseudospiralis TaxID=6337 RepID=A0A0V1JRC8_TRIPS|nr:hypothetical protein T4C_7484 [Trichinella pseudospiralis]